MKYLHTSDKKLSYKNFIKLIRDELEENKDNYIPFDSTNTIIEIDDLFLINPEIVEAVRNKTLVRNNSYSRRTSVFDLVKSIYRKFNDPRYINKSTLYISLVRRNSYEKYAFKLFLLDEEETSELFIASSIDYTYIQGTAVQPLFYKVINGGLNRVKEEHKNFCQRKNCKSIFEEYMVLDNLLLKSKNKQKSTTKYKIVTENIWETYVGQLPYKEYFKVDDVIRLNPEWIESITNWVNTLSFRYSYSIRKRINKYLLAKRTAKKSIRITNKNKNELFVWLLNELLEINNYSACSYGPQYGEDARINIYPLIQKRIDTKKIKEKIIDIKEVKTNNNIEFSDDNEIDLLLDNI